MLLETCEIAFDGVFDVGNSLCTFLSFRNASGQCGALGYEVAIFILLDNYSVLHRMLNIIRRLRALIFLHSPNCHPTMMNPMELVAQRRLERVNLKQAIYRLHDR